MRFIAMFITAVCVDSTQYILIILYRRALKMYTRGKLHQDKKNLGFSTPD